MLDVFSEELSDTYYSFIDKIAKNRFECDKLLGKFYTDYGVTDNMCARIVDHLSVNRVHQKLTIIDPFCGDGRLIVELLTGMLAANLLIDVSVSVTIWDIDSEAVQQAEVNIKKYCDDNRLNCTVISKVTDAFIEYKNNCNAYNICVTNPPWVLLKPQKIINKDLDKTSLEKYKTIISAYDTYVKDEFITSQPTSKFGKWGTNLARCGVEVALRMLCNDGICGVVSPASLLNDQVSGKLREWMFESYNVVSIDYYPAEMKLYGVADVASVAIVLSSEQKTDGINFRKYSNGFEYNQKKIECHHMDYIKENQYNVPLKTGIESIQIMTELEKLPSTLECCTESGFSFTREMDETRVMEKLLPHGDIVFAKGYMVDRYSFSDAGLFLNEKKYEAPSSTQEYKIVWRDVSRDSQKRRIKATLLPPGYICGNSLGIIYGKKDRLPELKMLLAIINSAVFEYQARCFLVSNHVSSGIIKRIHMPRAVVDEYIIGLVDRQLSGENLEAKIESAIAHMYGISLGMYTTILDSFRFSDGEKEELLSEYINKRNGVFDK